MEIYHYQGKISLDEYFERCKVFHGSLAPGLVLGGVMVDWILEDMGLSREYDAVVETRKCLPDAVQLLTKCSVGNGWMKILDWGKLAITLYDIHTREAMRVSLDDSKLDRYPLVQAWASNTKSKADNPLEPLVDEIIQGGRDLFIRQYGSVGTVPEQVAPYERRRTCSQCGEVFRYGSDTVCEGCLNPFFKVSKLISSGSTNPYRSP